MTPEERARGVLIEMNYCKVGREDCFAHKCKAYGACLYHQEVIAKYLRTAEQEAYERGFAEARGMVLKVEPKPTQKEESDMQREDEGHGK